MTGALVNALAVIICGGLGVLIRKVLKESLREVLTEAIGIAVITVGVLDAIKTENTLLLVLSIVLGGFIGHLIGVQKNLDRFGKFLESKIASKDNSQIGQGFVTATLIFCVGGMVIYGSINAGLGNNETLYIKSIMDGVTSFILSSVLGWGVMLSAVPVLVLQGGIALLAKFIEPIATEAFINQLSGIGGTLIIAIALSLLGIKKIRTGDLLPAVLGTFLIFII
jgi:uncharacterized membrane protein YqgA involved in biofilm formation